ncbi:HesA/MoeB/ThiF family protein [Bacillus sp. FJAT-27916]|uniref:HesA/MoeB/ThiF family protein n=1 Tax=Bacillus sp. FJAT-27916 TaxID=1679169 RepID=UPI001E5C646A|nr:ThiF family adenylyltransferase [Bacillus sp. FJAT-27916]
MKSYKFIDSVKFYTNNEQDLHIVFMNEQKRLVYKVNKVTLKLLELIGNKESYENITKIMLSEYDISNKNIDEVFLNLIQNNIIEENEDKEQNDYYEFLDRQINFLSQYTNEDVTKTDIQDYLKKSHVVILGCGGVGSWIAYNLAQSGVGTLTLIDNDVVELSNLNRQALYFSEDIDKYKVEVLMEKLKKINPELSINIFKTYINDVSDLNIIPLPANLLINCADKPNSYETGMIVTRYACKNKMTNMNGIGYRGNVCRLGNTTIPGETMCWNCINQNNEWELKDLEQVKFGNHHSSAGSIASISSLIGSIHSLEALKILIPTAKPSLINGIGEIDISNLKIEFTLEKQTKDCKVCGRRRKDDNK